MIFHVIAVLMVKVAIVQIIRVTVVFYSFMTAIGTMRMGMGAWMLKMWLGHFSVLSQSGVSGVRNAKMPR
jgi:uncharacterized membrane protein (DUF2068 family)